MVQRGALWHIDALGDRFDGWIGERGQEPVAAEVAAGQYHRSQDRKVCPCHSQVQRVLPAAS